jgi:hypothetical protein
MLRSTGIDRGEGLANPEDRFNSIPGVDMNGFVGAFMKGVIDRF